MDPMKGLAVVEPLPLTVPVSPNITHTHTANKRKSPQVEKPIFKARAVPNFFKPQLLAKLERMPVSEAQPFTLRTDKRGAEYQARLQAKLEEERRSAAKNTTFVARPMVDSSPMRVRPSLEPLTQPQPFHLRSAELSEAYRHSLEIKIQEEELQRERQFSSFRARPAPAILDAPDFVPEHPHRQSESESEAQAFVLASEERAARRRQWDEEQAEKQRQREIARAEEERQLKAEEQLMLAKVRKELVHKALPIMQAATMQIHRSQVPLTEPKSPALGLKRRPELLARRSSFNSAESRV